MKRGKMSPGKYRGLTLTDNKLITGSAIFTMNKVYIATSMDEEITIHEVNPDSVAEYIGILDSYDTEIYSDDICIESHKAFDPCLFNWGYGIVERFREHKTPDQYFPYRHTDHGIGFAPHNIVMLDIELRNSLDKITGEDAGIIEELDIKTENAYIKYGSDSPVSQFICFQVIKDREKAEKYMKMRENTSYID